MSKSARKRKTSVGSLMIQGAREAVAHKRGELPDAPVTRAKVTVRRAEVVPPPAYREQDIHRLRERLGLPQTVFANLLGASTSTVRAWERGARQPSDMARPPPRPAGGQPGGLREKLGTHP